MTRTRANWHLDFAVDESDPFELKDVGVPIDLSQGEAVLHKRLSQTLKVEAALYEKGCSCPIKDDPQSCCSACPVRHSDPTEDMSALCAVGTEQEQLLTRLAVARHGT